MVSQILSFTLALPVLFLLQVLDVRGYTPAKPSNGTVLGRQTSQVNTYILHLQWYTNGSNWGYVARQSGGPNNDLARGVLVHFTENNAGNETTTTPWIAFVACDANLTNTSNEVDVFTMARDRGAKSAILYSLYSETCVIDTGYQNSVLDVFTMRTSNTSRHIEYEFGHFGPSSLAYYGYFNATMLNEAAGVINESLTLDYPTTPGFLFAALATYDLDHSSIPSGGLQSSTNETQSSTSSTSSSQNTGVAMIVLYTITGCVSALFCAVIVSGAIRAIRYPERYGPRLADPTLGGGQSRAGGLGRAILDTFPIVKFRSSGADRESSPAHHKDTEAAPVETDSNASIPLRSSVRLARPSLAAELDEHHTSSEGTVAPAPGQEVREESSASEGIDHAGLPPETSTAEREESRIPVSRREIDPRMPECIGRETCPICIVDFEEGDDLRVLPCEGKHRFHQSCVDSWLLELSASCPICRQDFRALETIISGNSGSETTPANRYSEPTAQNRFSRYLRFVRRQERSRDRESLPPAEP